jgi:CBS domain-containing protein
MRLALEIIQKEKLLSFPACTVKLRPYPVSTLQERMEKMRKSPYPVSPLQERMEKMKKNISGLPIAGEDGKNEKKANLRFA